MNKQQEICSLGSVLRVSFIKCKILVQNSATEIRFSNFSQNSQYFGVNWAADWDTAQLSAKSLVPNFEPLRRTSNFKFSPNYPILRGNLGRGDRHGPNFREVIGRK